MPTADRRFALGVAAAFLGSGLLSGPAAGADAAETPSPPGKRIRLTLTNPLAEPREAETIVISQRDLSAAAPGFLMKRVVVLDATDEEVLSQLIDLDGDASPDELVFQVALAPNETRTLTLIEGQRHPAARADFRVYGRFVRERYDDFAWENDRVAHRMYGPALETWEEEPLTSSGIDVWVKRVPRLVVNDWYMVDDYHRDRGEGGDLYSVGTSRGCGGLGIWRDGQLHVSRNFSTSRVLANGPLRLVFELDYAPWGAGGNRVAETKRVTVDGGTSFDRFVSTFTGTSEPLEAAIGIARHEGSAVEIGTDHRSMRTWEPISGDNGNLGCAIVLPPGTTGRAEQTQANYLLVTQVPEGGTLTYFAGAGWDRGGHVQSREAWGREVSQLQRRLAAPVQVALTPLD